MLRPSEARAFLHRHDDVIDGPKQRLQCGFGAGAQQAPELAQQQGFVRRALAQLEEQDVTTMGGHCVLQIVRLCDHGGSHRHTVRLRTVWVLT